MPKQKPKDFSKLTQAQSAFICAKVQELGSVEAVRKHYPKRCLVDQFAKLVAVGLFGGRKRRAKL